MYFKTKNRSKKCNNSQKVVAKNVICKKMLYFCTFKINIK